MSDDHHDQPETVTVTASVLAFGTTAVLSLVGMALILIYNHNGGF
jgi:hypothetical protein